MSPAAPVGRSEGRCYARGVDPIETCRACGAAASGYVCLYCGASLTPALDYDAERQALEELHQAMLRAAADADRARILGHGPIPDDDRALVDAGLRAAALLVPQNYADATPGAAIARIEAIRAKLRMRGNAVADRELGARVDEYQKGAARESDTGLRAVLVLVAALTAIVVVIVLALRR